MCMEMESGDSAFLTFLEMLSPSQICKTNAHLIPCPQTPPKENTKQARVVGQGERIACATLANNGAPPPLKKKLEECTGPGRIFETAGECTILCDRNRRRREQLIHKESVPPGRV